MKAIFYAAGPYFQRKTIKEVENIDVAPTITEVLGISPPQDAQGRKIDPRDNGNRESFFR
jgi:arylsulfatase A-like enzyme